MKYVSEKCVGTLTKDAELTHRARSSNKYFTTLCSKKIFLGRLLREAAGEEHGNEETASISHG